MGVLAMEMLIERISGRSESRQVLMNAHLVARGSTRRPGEPR